MSPLPQGTWDTHVHLFDGARYPFCPRRSYTPGAATLPDLKYLHEAWGVGHTVLVQPSPYGLDNGLLLEGLAELGPMARGVAVVDPSSVTDAELTDLSHRGIAGLRINLVGGGAPCTLTALAQRLQGGPMFLQLYAPLDQVLAKANAIRAAGVPVLLDHFGGCSGSGQDDVSALLELTGSADIWIKLSADYRLNAPCDALIAAFTDAIPDRLIWGADWPHTGGGADRRARPLTDIEPFQNVDGLSVITAIQRTAPHVLKQICVDNPRRLFGAAPTSILPKETP